MITFCDGSTPPILEGLTIPESPFHDVQAFIREPWYLKFNNSAVYTSSKNKSTGFERLFWDLGMKSFEEFYE
jgi:hypothetical protein